VIDRHVPAFLHGLARDIAGVRDSSLYHELQSGGLSYRMYCFAKD
jgi:fatty-acid O-methyltransferase